MLTSLRRSPAMTAHVLLLGVVLVWGTTFTLVKAALRDISPLLFNFLRMLLAAAVLALYNWKRLKTSSKADIRAGCAAGFFLALGYQFQTAGLARTTPTKSAFITGLVVVLVPLIAVIPGVRTPGMTPTKWNGFAGAILAFIGLVLLTTPANSSTLLSGIGLGEVLTLGCAFAFAGHLLFIARVSPGMDARKLGAIQIVAASLVMLITLPAEAHPMLRWNSTIAYALLVTSLLATAAAFTIQSWAQQHIRPMTTALIFTLEPVFAWLTSLTFLHERLSSRSLQGAGLILTGILISELWPIRKTKKLITPEAFIH